MTTLTLPRPRPELSPQLGLLRRQIPRRFISERLLVLTDDRPFWENLSMAARAFGRKLIRSKATPDPRTTDETANFAAVLLDLDARAAWGAADSMLRDEHSPPVFLLTSRNDPDWSSAVQAGSVLDKRTDAASLLRQVSTWLSVPARLAREIKSAQRLVIRWLKPCNWPATAIPLRRHWGINE